MADTTTTKHGFVKPEVNASDDTWGAKLNTDLDQIDALINIEATTTEVLTGTVADKEVTPDALAALWELGASVAAASTVTLGEGGLFVITGTGVNITDIDFTVAKDGRRAFIQFAGANTITAGANLIIPGVATYTTAAGDIFEVIQTSGDTVYVLDHRMDADLAAIAALATNGLLTRTAAGAMTTRTITGTAPITVTNGDGVAGNPVVAIAATFGGLLNVQAFSADGTYTPTANTRSILVIATGGGGGGGGGGTTDNATGGGGGAGATAIGFIASPAASYAVDVGAGGTAGVATGGNGGAAAATTFGGAGVLSANGGSGGDGRTTAGATNGGLGGTGTAGSALISGVAGGDGAPGFNAAGGGTAYAGSGGASFWGGGGRASAGPGGKQNGKGWGSGGGGGVRLSGTNDAGGVGSVGFVLVLEFG